MAKVRRVIRKLQTKSENDLQFWPVVVSVCVFGGFLLGVILIYLNDHFLFWPALIGLPIAMGALIIALRIISNRYLNRTMQFALVLSLLINAFILIIAYERELFARLGEIIPAVADIERERTARPVPEFQRQSRVQQEINERVRTDTPDPERDELEKKETQPDKKPPEPQPLPVPEPKETPDPNVLERKQQNETPPRQSKNLSRMSRQTQSVPLRSGVTANTVQRKQQSTTKSPSRQQTELEKRTAENNTRKRSVQRQPTSVKVDSTQQVNRKQPQNQPRTDSQSVAQLPRAIADRPQLAPKAVLPTPQNPNTPQQTQPQAKPNNSQVAKQTTSIPVQRTTPQPTPNTQVTADSKPQRHQINSPTLPQTARTAVPETSRSRISPNLATNSTATASQAPKPAAKPAPQRTAQDTSANKRSSESPLTQRTTPDVSPTAPTNVVASNPQRRQSQSRPETNATPANPRSIKREAPANSVTSNTRANTAKLNAPAKTANESPQLAAANTNTSRQATSNTSERRANANPSPATESAAAPTPNPNRAATRQPRGPSSDNVASAPKSVQRARTTPNSLTSPATTSADVPRPQSPNVASAPSISPSNTAIQRSPASTPSATVNARTAETPTNAVASQVPRPSSERTQSESVPSLSPKSIPRPNAARSELTAQAPSTNVAVESPAPVQTNNSTGPTSNQPAPLALNKAPSSGTAGIGRSQNLDRFTPTAEGSASVALDSASRPRATQTETGSSFSPNATAQIRRSVADQPAPTATQQVNANTVAPLPGSSEPSTTNSTTSAVSIDSKSTADLGDVTASRGNVQVDVGPSRLVADNSKGKRAAGGGRPQLNYESDSNQVSRQQPGGAPSTSIAAATVDDIPMAPKGGGGTPSTSELNPKATALARAESGGPESLSAGPTSKALSGPTSNTNNASDLAQTPASRAEAAEAAPGDLATGGSQPDDEDEEERRRRLARAALAAGGPAATLPGSLKVELPTQPSETGGGQLASSAPTGPVGPQASEIARAAPSGGVPASQPNAAIAQGPPASTGGAESAGEIQIARADPADGEPGLTRTGGGTNSPARAATGPAFQPSLEAEAVAIAGGPSSGVPQSQPLDAQGVEATKLAGGALSAAMAGPLGAMANQSAASAVGSAVPGAMAGQRKTSPADDGPRLASGPNSGSPLPRADLAGLPPGTLAMADIQLPQATGGPSAPSASDVALPGGNEVGPVKRDAAGSALLDVDAKAGPGGLGDKFAPDAGINTRRARRDSPVLRVFSDARIVRSNPGGVPGTSAAAVVSTDGFRSRRPGAGRGESGALSPETEASIETGLVFLQRHQSPDGSWSLARFTQGRTDRVYQEEYKAALDSDTAATGLAILAFQGAGYHHKDYQYATTLSSGLNWLLEHQKENGDLFVRMDDDSNAAVWLYSHAIAAMALSEAYGMTQDPDLREPAQKALDFLAKAQNQDRGGWRYSPGVGSDTSVTGWVFMAMYSGKVAGLNVPDASLRRVEHWLNLCQKSATERHLYRYNPYAPDTDEQRHGRTPNSTMTAVGLTLRIYLGWETDNEYLQKGADYLLESMPQMGYERRLRYAHLSPRDAYYWYYATQVMAHLGDEHWRKWNARLHPLLLETQTKTGPMAGSWDPIRPTVDRWGPHAGRIYVTTLNLLSLEARHRKLPIYKATVAKSVE